MSRIAIDYTPAYEQGAGIGRYVRELVAALADVEHNAQFRLFVSGAGRDQLPALPGTEFEWRTTPLSPKWLARIWHRLGIPIAINHFTGPVDLFHATDFVLPPTNRHTRTILTVHDLSYLRVPEAASPRLKSYLEQVVPRSVQRATHVLADSQATKSDLISYYNVSEDKVSVLLSGVSDRFRPTSGHRQRLNTRYNLPDAPFLFAVGTVQPRKNYVRLVEVLKQLRDDGFDHHLVIAGGKGWLEDPLYKIISQLELKPCIHLIGFADDADLPALYSEAACVVFPSLYEGFGFPVLEGMACGVPVVTSTVSSLPEVGGDAALLVDPYDTDAIYSAVKSILQSPDVRQQLITSGIRQASQFTWEQSATRLVQIYKQVLDL